MTVVILEPQKISRLPVGHGVSCWLPANKNGPRRESGEVHLLAVDAGLTVRAQGRADYTGVEVKFRTHLFVML